MVHEAFSKTLEKALQDINSKRHKANPFDERYLGLCLSAFAQACTSAWGKNIIQDAVQQLALHNLQQHARGAGRRTAPHLLQRTAAHWWKALPATYMPGLRCSKAKLHHHALLLHAALPCSTKCLWCS